MKKIKNLWNQNRVLFVLGLIIIICFLIIIGVFIKYFFGTSKSSYGDRLEGIEEVLVTDSIKNDYITKMNEDELINETTLEVKGKIIYIHITFNPAATLVEAQSKALASLSLFTDDYLDFYDIHFTLESNENEPTEEFLLMGSHNKNGSGLIWNNNTEFESNDSE